MIFKAFIIAVALSVDSMAVSLSGSVSMGRIVWSKICKVALILAIVQTVLLGGGYFAGERISSFVSEWGPWIGLVLLLYVGGSMLVEAIRGGEDEQKDFGSIWKILLAALATSIDAFASGGSFGLTLMPIGEFLTIALMTFLATVAFAVLGMVCGSALGRKLGRPAKVAAGIVLIAIGVGIVL